MTKSNSIENFNWDFLDSNTKYATHGFHTYPAMMIPQVANQLILEFATKKSLVFDPYCGSGTSLVEANLAGLNAVGTDINPLARLIAKVKTTVLEHQVIDLYFKDFYDLLFKYRFGISKKDSVVQPKFQNIEYWFSKNVLSDLSIIKEYIDAIEDEDIKNFFIIAFSQTIRECSWTRKNEYKLYRMSKEKIKIFKPDVFSTFETILAKNKKGLLEFIERRKNCAKSTVIDFDTVYNSPKNIINEKEFDLVLTSPPYGDSKTTVAYGQFSRLTNQWLQYSKANTLDSDMMGGKNDEKIEKLTSISANSIINKIKNIDSKRAGDVFSFYRDYSKSISNIVSSLAKNAYICYVVSNRCVKGITLPTHKITEELFEANGLKHKYTFKRKISNKRLPRLNSPKGVSGETTKTMNQEYIIIMKKIT